MSSDASILDDAPEDGRPDPAALALLVLVATPGDDAPVYRVVFDVPLGTDDAQVAHAALLETTGDLVMGESDATEALVAALLRSLQVHYLSDGTPAVWAVGTPATPLAGQALVTHYARAMDAEGARADRALGALRDANDRTYAATQEAHHALHRQHAAERERDEQGREVTRLRGLIDAVRAILIDAPGLPRGMGDAKLEDLAEAVVANRQPLGAPSPAVRAPSSPAPAAAKGRGIRRKTTGDQNR